MSSLTPRGRPESRSSPGRGAGEHLRARFADLVDRHRIELGDDFRRLDQATVDRELAGDVMGLPPGALHRHQKAGAGLGPDPVDLALGQGVDRVGDDLLDQLGGRGRFAPGGRGVDVEQPAVGVGMELRIDGISEPALLADLLEQARRHSAADDVAEHARREIIGIELGRTGEAQSEMGLVRGGPADPRAAGESRRLGGLDRSGGKLGEPSLGQLDQPLMLDLARRDEGEAAGAVAAPAPVVEILDLDRVDARLAGRGRAGRAAGRHRRPTTDRRR